MDTCMSETDLYVSPLMSFVDKSERNVTVVSIDSNHTFWILFIRDRVNVCYFKICLFKY